MRIVVLNNYSMQHSLTNCESGLAGRHHLWGGSEFPRHGLEVEYLAYRRWLRMQAVSRWIGAWGDLDQEIRVILKRRYDVLYAAAASVAMDLAFLRAMHMYRKPIVGLFHQVPSAKNHSRRCVRGVDRIACINSSVAERMMARFPECGSRISVTEWGWDLGFPWTMEGPGEYVLSIGMSMRDYDTFCRALARIPVAARIICTRSCQPQVAVDRRTEVRIVDRDVNWMFESELRSYYRGALAVAVPLQRSVRSVTAGISSILEAMAHGRAVLCTRTDCLDVDLEKEGCGLWIEPEDVDGWVRAIDILVNNPDVAAEMGRRGRALCETRYNIERFGDQVAYLLQDAVTSHSGVEIPGY